MFYKALRNSIEKLGRFILPLLKGTFLASYLLLKRAAKLAARRETKE